MVEENVPRRPINPSPEAQIWETLGQLQRAIVEMQRASTLRNASISGGTGIRLLQEASADGEEGKLRIWINPDGTITAFDVNNGEPMVRMGRMLNSGPAAYGIEVKVGSNWVQLGSQTVTWNNIQGKPSTFPIAGHQHGGGDITSPVADASNSGHSMITDGSQYAFNNTVSGSTFYQVWVGNDGGYHLGRNVSSQRFKQNIKQVPAVDKSVLGVKTFTFDRKGGGPKNEFGVLAEQAHQHFPQATQYFEGEIDGVRYELYGAALIPVVKEHDDRLERLEKLVQEQAAEIKTLKETRP